jgi:hypothetical protein
MFFYFVFLTLLINPVSFIGIPDRTGHPSSSKVHEQLATFNAHSNCKRPMLLPASQRLRWRQFVAFFAEQAACER